LGQSAGAFFDAQIGPWQSVHLRWTDGTFGVGMSATRAPTTQIPSLTTYNIGCINQPDKCCRGEHSQTLFTLLRLFGLCGSGLSATYFRN
jgi:hypothetical protein